MKFSVLATTCLVVGIAHGAALSEKVLADAHTQIVGNASSILGWQLAGSQQNQASLESACNDISWLGHGRWAAIGLKPEYIQEALCAAKHYQPDPVRALAGINSAATDMFVAQVLHSFGDNATSRFDWLCENFDYDAISDQLNLDSYRVASTVCNTKTDSSGWTPRDTVGTDPYIYNKTSVIFATQYAVSVTTVTERWVMCEQYNYVAQSQLQEGINSTVVREAICRNHDEPLISLELAAETMYVMQNDVFLQQLAIAVGADKNGEKQDWLCKNIEHGDLCLIGLTNANMFC